MLDLASLQSATAALARALSVTSDARQWETFNTDLQDVLRAGVIQTFEVAYEQSWKMVRRWLVANPAAGDVEGVPMRQLFRIAARAGLIDDVDGWMEFHKARSQTSHTYNWMSAQAVFEMAPAFLAQAQALLATLERRRD